MRRTPLNLGWRFASLEYNRDWYKPPARRDVVLPHDFQIGLPRDARNPSGAHGGYFPGGIGEYEYTLDAPECWRDSRVLLEFEGVYMNAVVRVNANVVATHPYGYTSFHCDLTPYLRLGRKNTVQVSVNNVAIPNTRWYSGMGIFRPVWLLVGGPARIAPWGVCVTTPDATERGAGLCVRTRVINDGEPRRLTLRMTARDADGQTVACADTPFELPAGETEVTQNARIANPRLWSPDSPALYELCVELLDGEARLDAQCETFGVRTVALSAQNGLLLNGAPIKLRGGCVHHDCGVLGAASYPDAETRKVRLLKESGYNAIRCAHNPPSPAFLAACDRLGMLVIDEAFDCWVCGKTPGDYHNYFEDRWRRDIDAMVLRDRNHPSVFAWSTGNEVGERDGRTDGAAWARKLADYVRSLDDTRYITNALCGVGADKTYLGEEAVARERDWWGDLTEAFVQPLDIVGYNYLYERYERDARRFPDRVICGLESFPLEAYNIWEVVSRMPAAIGDFVWTSMDYLGESGIGNVSYDAMHAQLKPHPWHVAWCGDIDLCGDKRPQSYFRDAVWARDAAPYIAVYPPERHGQQAFVTAWGWPDVRACWTYPGWEGKPTQIEVYSSAEEIELTLNGQSVARAPVEKCKAVFSLNYAPGTLRAIAYRAGAEISSTELVTSGNASHIHLTADCEKLHADCQSLCYVTVQLLDAQGNPADVAADKLFFACSGAGTLLAVANGDPASEEGFTGGVRSAWHGRAMAVVRAGGEPGELLLTVSAQGMPPAQVRVAVVS